MGREMMKRSEREQNGRRRGERGAREVSLTFWVTPMERRLITRVLAQAGGHASGRRAGALMMMLGLGASRHRQ